MVRSMLARHWDGGQEHTNHEGVEKGEYHRYREDIVELVEWNRRHCCGCDEATSEKRLYEYPYG